MSLFPWRTNCGCLLDDGGCIRLVERCDRHAGAPLVVVHASYPPVAKAGSGASGAPSASTHSTPPMRAADGPTDGSQGNTADNTEAG